MGSKLVVSSVTYPLGNDDPDNYVDYRKHTVINSVLQGRDIAKSVTNTYQKGLGNKLRNAYRYARDHYYYGVPYSGSLYVNSPDKVYLANLLKSREKNQEILLNIVKVGLADFTYWAERWLANTYGYDRIAQRFMRPPAGVEATAAVTFDVAPNGTIRAFCTNAGGAQTILSYKPNDLDSRRLYVHCMYQTNTPYPAQVTKSSRAPEPGETDFTSVVTVIDEEVTQLRETTTTTHGEIIAGVMQITVTEKLRVVSRPKYFLYEIGAGDFPVIDGWLTAAGGPETSSPYFPCLPLRIYDTDLTDGKWATSGPYPTGKKLFKRVGVDVDLIVEKLNDNENIGEIDFAYLTFGVALNSKTPECKEYIFRFLDYLRGLSIYVKADTDAWIARHNLTQVAMAATNVGGEGESGGGGTIPPTGTGSDPNIGYETPPTNVLRIYDPETKNDHSTLDIQLQWKWTEYSVHAGKIQGYPNAKPGECAVFTRGGIQQYLNYEMQEDNSSIVAQRQIDADTYEEIVIGGFLHINFVYQDNAIFVTAWDAMIEPDEEGFLLPLNQEILREMSLPDVTQLGYDCVHLVLNCYKIVKKKWYQSTWFSVLLIIIAIVLLVITWGGSSGLSGAMIGTATGNLIITIAITLGVSMLVAMVIVATITVVAMMLLMKVLTPVFTDLFGPTWGPVLATIFSMWVGAGMSGTGGFAGAAQNMVSMSASTFINGSIAVVNLYSKYMEGKIAGLDVAGQIEELKSEEKARTEEIERLTKELLGTHTDIIDIQGFIKASEFKYEGPDSFFRRTLMTGNDVCRLTQGQVEDFVELGLYLPTHP